MPLLRLPALLLALVCLGAHAEAPPLRVCADPDSLPQSHRDGTGFENRIAALLADALGRPLQVHWIPLQGRVVAATLGAGVCDVLLGVPAGYPRTATTVPYYRSTFVWVQRRGEAPPEGLDDPRLAQWRIGVPQVRHDPAATPAAHAVQQRWSGVRLVGFPVESGDAGRRLAQAVARGDVDAALAWGPQIGWYVRQQAGTLAVTPMQAPGLSHLPLQVPISLAVRKGDQELLARLDAVLREQRGAIERILGEAGVPLLP